MKFSELGLSEALQQSIIQAGYQKPTPIQEQAIPRILAGGDLIASAQTGTGKTAAFALPILQRLSQKNYTKVRPIRALVIAPTRELASQVGASFKVLGAGLMPKLRCIEVFGGVKVEGQEHKLKLGCDILIGTPGRLLDLISQGIVRLALIETVVLDEGDRLLEMGFLPDIRSICSQIPASSQRLMFSATFSDDVDRMSAFLLHKPSRLSPETNSVVVAKIRQVQHHIHGGEKLMALRTLLEQAEDSQALVFVNTRAQAADVGRALGFAGISVGSLHGEVDQKGRTKVLADFVSGAIRILVATDVAARGLHIPDLPLVINYEVPSNSEDYIHRIGRTGRSGKAGRAVTLVAPSEMQSIDYIEELIGEKIERQKIPGFKVSQESPRKRKEELEEATEAPRRPKKGPRPKDPRNRGAVATGSRKSQQTHKNAEPALPARSARTGTKNSVRGAEPRSTGRSDERTAGKSNVRSAEPRSSGRTEERGGGHSKSHGADARGSSRKVHTKPNTKKRTAAPKANGPSKQRPDKKR